MKKLSVTLFLLLLLTMISFIYNNSIQQEAITQLESRITELTNSNNKLVDQKDSALGDIHRLKQNIETEKEVQFYRGMYVGCTAINTVILKLDDNKFCFEMTKSAQENNIYTASKNEKEEIY